MWMSEVLPTLNQATLWDTRSATSSPVEDSGLSPCDGPDGPTTGRSGPEAAPAPLSQQQAKAAGLVTLVNFGRIGIGSSTSRDLQSSLVNSLMTRLDSAGSTLFKQTWKRRRTPLGRWYLEHTASAQGTFGSGFTLWPTPKSSDGEGGGMLSRISRQNGGGNRHLKDHALLSG